MRIKKKQRLQRAKDRNQRLMEMVEREREKIAGHEQMAKVYSAYIYLLLKKLEATKDSMVTFKKDEIQEAIQSCAIRALPVEDGWSLYYEE